VTFAGRTYRGRARTAVSGVVVLLALLMALPPGFPPARPGAGSADIAPAVIYPAQANYTLATVDYNSSVDGFPLSYSEILPLNYSPSQTYPLAIELHGIDTSGSTPLPGGYPTPVTNSTADAAVAAGFIEIVINTRTSDGFFVNSKYDGPQAQDVLDAIAHEESIRHIGKLYIFGFSMGSMGALSIGLNHPGMFAGIGAVAAFSDDFELEGRVQYLGNTALVNAGLLPTGGLWPNSSSYAQGIFEELSPLRFHPENASGVRMWFAGGANDVFATNNQSFWPYEQANATVLDSTCLVESSLGEPANCTIPLAALRAEDPADYSYRYVFEPNGIHDYALLNATDMFEYFSGQLPPGEFWGYFPDPTLIPPPTPLITLVTEPTGCGSVAVNGTPLPSLETVAAGPGYVPLTIQPCEGTAVGGVTAAGGVYYDSSNGTVDVLSSGSILVQFAAPEDRVQFATDSACGSILFGGTPEAANESVLTPPGSYLVSAEPCDGHTFSSWAASGDIELGNSSAATTTVNVTGGGTLTVGYVENPVPTPTVAVTVDSAPGSCGPLLLGGSAVGSGSVIDIATGVYALGAPACTGYAFVAWSESGGAVVASQTAETSVSISSAGTVTAVYAALAVGELTVLVSVSPAACGPTVQVGEGFYGNASLIALEPGNYEVAAAPCAGFEFQGWTTSGGVSVTGNSLGIDANGSVGASYVPDNGSLGGTTGGGGGASVTTEAEWLLLGTGIGLVAAGLLAVAVARPRTRAGRATEPDPKPEA
jgi:pimeloyl-ACP methyl ester carboxylesterase